MSWPAGSVDPTLLTRVARLVRAEARSRHLLLGWWLPGGAAALVAAVGALFRFPWPYWIITLGSLFIFNRYHRWKLRLVFSSPVRWYWGRLSDGSDRLSRGHRQSHGLMYPIEVLVVGETTFAARDLADDRLSPHLEVNGEAPSPDAGGALELEANGEGVPALLKVNELPPRVLNFWIDGSVLAELGQDHELGLLQIGEESVLAVIVETHGVLVSRSVPVPDALSEHVRWPR